MVYGIIKQNDGFINVYSEPGKGSTFRIYLPLIQPAELENNQPIVFNYPAGGSETILLAEDDDVLRKLTVLVLEQVGYKVITSKDGAEAVQKFQENQNDIQLLLFDIIMPKKSGKEAYNEIRRTRPDIPVIFTSGYSPDVIHRKDYLEPGALIISKPISPAILLQRVRSVLDGKH
jgi:DNA-binding response OmpR family regulator